MIMGTNGLTASDAPVKTEPIITPAEIPVCLDRPCDLSRLNVANETPYNAPDVRNASGNTHAKAATDVSPIRANAHASLARRATEVEPRTDATGKVER
jgi:hypothetical protein